MATPAEVLHARNINGLDQQTVVSAHIDRKNEFREVANRRC
jgi:hypothetical protein